MNCEQAIELLPWWLNRTLEEGERRQVEEHLAGCTSCREALAETRAATRTFGQHLPAEVLIAQAYGETPAGYDPDLADRHLESCPQCAADLELARMSRRLEEDSRLAVMPFAAPVAKKAPASSRAWRSSALAASLVGVLALSGWLHSGQKVRSLEALLEEKAVPAAPAAGSPAPSIPAPDTATRERLAELEAQIQRMQGTEAELREKERQVQDQLARLEARPAAGGASGTGGAPQINTFVEDVMASGIAERGGSRTIEIPASTTSSTLLLRAEHAETHRDHEIEILDAAGKPVWSARGLRRNAGTDDYAVTFPPGFLKPGTYTIRVVATEGGERVPTESYAVRAK